MGQFFVVGCVSLERGPLESSFDWKSRCWLACFGSTCPCVGFDPSRFSLADGVPVLDDVVEDPAAACGTADEVSVFGDGVVAVLRSHPATSAAAKARVRTHSFIVGLRFKP